MLRPRPRGSSRHEYVIHRPEPIRRDCLVSSWPMRIREVAPADMPAVLTLNNQHAAEVNELTADGLARIASVAMYMRLIEDGLGFLVAFDETTPSQGPNHA